MKLIYLILGVEALIMGFFLLYIYTIVRRDIRKYNEAARLARQEG